MLNLKKGQLPIFIVNLIYLAIALYAFLGRKNYEFVMYIGVIVFFLIIILFTNKKVNYPNFLLWGLTLWGLMHMAGGGWFITEDMILYKLILIPISAEYGIFRYDQLVHIVGFFVSTLLMYILINPHLKSKVGWWSLGIVLAMAGLGVGALNEIVEFTATVLVPETGVGGYINTSLDLVADLIGAILGTLWIRFKKGNI